MISKREFLKYVRQSMDPDEIVDEFGLTSDELLDNVGELLYRRRYRIAYRFDEDALEELDYVSDEDDEEAYSLRALDDYDDPFENEPGALNFNDD